MDTSPHLGKPSSPLGFAGRPTDHHDHEDPEETLPRLDEVTRRISVELVHVLPPPCLTGWLSLGSLELAAGEEAQGG